MNAKTQDSTTNDKRSFLNLVKKIHYTYKKVPAAFIEIELPKFVYPVYFEERENLGRENFVRFNLKNFWLTFDTFDTYYIPKRKKNSKSFN